MGSRGELEKRSIQDLQEGVGTFPGGVNFGEASASCLYDARKRKRLQLSARIFFAGNASILLETLSTCRNASRRALASRRCVLFSPYLPPRAVQFLSGKLPRCSGIRCLRSSPGFLCRQSVDGANASLRPTGALVPEWRLCSVAGGRDDGCRALHRGIFAIHCSVQ